MKLLQKVHHHIFKTLCIFDYVFQVSIDMFVVRVSTNMKNMFFKQV